MLNTDYISSLHFSHCKFLVKQCVALPAASDRVRSLPRDGTPAA
jgi:hypothetical protein